MPLTNRQKTMGGVLLAAAAAFAWDRFGAKSPAASAGIDEGGFAPAELVQGDARTSAPTNAVASPPTRMGPRLAEMAAAEGLDVTRAADAFLLPADWPTSKRARTVAAAPPATLPAGPTDVEIDRALADEFVRKHHLDAVMARPGGGYAIVDGRGLQVGRAVDRFKLTSVSASSAVFQRGRVQVEIKLPSPADVHRDGSKIDNRPTADADE